MGKKSRGNASAGLPEKQPLPGDGATTEPAQKKQKKTPLSVPTGVADSQPGHLGSKRPRPEDTSATASAAKKLLSNNPFSALQNGAQPQSDPEMVPKKVKLPPFYVKGFPPELWEQLDFYIKQGLRCTIQRCTEGYKLMVPAENHYNAVQVLLDRMKLEYFSHDVEATKPLKVVLRGLHDMDTTTLMDEIKANGLKPVEIYKMTRSKVIKYRDQLYLVHLEKNSTTVKDLQMTRTLFHIVVKWERYKPTHRGVTQCSNCLLFGHGTRNCRMASRCIKCGKNHKIDDCDSIEEAAPTCANCGAAHKATSKACPKRAEYAEIRKKASSNNQPGRKKVPENNTQNFPSLSPVQPRPIPVLPPLSLKQQLAAAQSAAAAVPGQASGPSTDPPAPGLAGSTSDATDDSPMSTDEIVTLLAHAIIIKRTCATRTQQLQAIISFVANYGP